MSRTGKGGTARDGTCYYAIGSPWQSEINHKRNGLLLHGCIEIYINGRLC